MTYQAAVFDRFGGLNLGVDPSEAGSYAIDGTDFDLTPLGEIRARSGSTRFSPSALESVPRAMTAYGSTGVTLVTVCDDFKLRVVDEGTGIGATSTALFSYPGSLVSYGTPTTRAAYSPVGSANNNIAKWDGAAFSFPATGYGAFFACVQPTDNRLVLANVIVNGANTIRFSDAGDPEVFGADNYVLLTPGREQIKGCCTWGNSIFVFKSSHFFEFYGNSQASDGAPIFNYRTVDSGIGISSDLLGSAQACVSAPDGVYFFAKHGIYRTTGGVPVKVSSQIDQAFIDGDLSDVNYVAMGFADDRVYVSAGDLTPTVTYVYWLDSKQWMRWSLPAKGWLSASGRQLFSFPLTKRIQYLDPGVSTDAGLPITASYQSGFFDLGQSNLKTIREILLTGKGAVDVQLTRDQAGFDQIPTSATEAVTVTLGTTAPKQGRVRRALRGAEFSYRLSGTAPWSVQRVAPGVRGTRPVGVETPA